MKKLVFLIGMLGTLSWNSVNAQVSVNVNFNIGSQPVWGPAGYNYARYYYMPDYDIYYDVTRRVFIYPRHGRWVTVTTLPAVYRNVNLYNTYKVVINDASPWQRGNVYRVKYKTYKGRSGQAVIRDSRDEKYYIIKEHPQHNAWERSHNKVIIQDRNPNRGKGHGRNNSGRGHGHR